jgi:hypothetical protein
MGHKKKKTLKNVPCVRHSNAARLVFAQTLRSVLQEKITGFVTLEGPTSAGPSGDGGQSSFLWRSKVI